MFVVDDVLKFNEFKKSGLHYSSNGPQNAPPDGPQNGPQNGPNPESKNQGFPLVLQQKREIRGQGRKALACYAWNKCRARQLAA